MIKHTRREAKKEEETNSIIHFCPVSGNKQLKLADRNE